LQQKFVGYVLPLCRKFAFKVGNLSRYQGLRECCSTKCVGQMPTVVGRFLASLSHISCCCRPLQAVKGRLCAFLPYSFGLLLSLSVSSFYFFASSCFACSFEAPAGIAAFGFHCSWASSKGADAKYAGLDDEVVNLALNLGSGEAEEGEETGVCYFFVARKVCTCLECLLQSC